MRATARVEAALARIAATDGRVNAFTAVLAERARARAQAVDARGLEGPLAGLPFAVKNLFDLAGLPTLAGSRIERTAAPARRDALLVRRLEAAGAVCVGALNMDEYAYGFTTENSHAGPTRNPHDLARIAGGSSGGSAAAVAAGQVPLTLGSDTNGSIRVPASLCGVFGLKPTFGRLPRTGTYPFVASLDHLGPLAQSVAALAAAYDAMQGPAADDPAQAPRAAEPTLAGIDHGSAGLRLGMLGGWFRQMALPAATAAVERCAQALGVTRVVDWPEVERARAAAFLITNAEGAALHLPDLRRRAHDFEPLSRARLRALVARPLPRRRAAARGVARAGAAPAPLVCAPGGGELRDGRRAAGPRHPVHRAADRHRMARHRWPAPVRPRQPGPADPARLLHRAAGGHRAAVGPRSGPAAAADRRPGHRRPLARGPVPARRPRARGPGARAGPRRASGMKGRR
jgi:amidase/aspartyl-tRNA(Asn)/glutamyl-tRNA(Gln) amidotransferase subunit A